MKKIAEFISFIFHPVLFFAITPYLIVYRQTANSAYALKWEAFSFIFILSAAVLFFWAKWRGIFSDQELTKKKERYDFYLLLWVFAVLYLVVAFGFKGLSFSLSLVSGGIVLGLVLFAIINYFLKISIHSAVSSAFVATVSILYGFMAFWLSFWIIPVIFWSRITLKKHTLKELLSGAILGTTITLLVFLAGKFIYLNLG